MGILLGSKALSSYRLCTMRVYVLEEIYGPNPTRDYIIASFSHLIALSFLRIGEGSLTLYLAWYPFIMFNYIYPLIDHGMHG